MKKVAIIGCTGMVGYNLFLTLANKYDIYGSCRNKYDLTNDNIYEFEHNFQNLTEFIDNIKPHVIINCVALLNENSEEEKLNMLYSNSIIPFQLNKICKEKNIYFIHFSTDAVFKSSNEYNKIDDCYSPESFYGMSKAISENIKNNSLVLRICPIGYDKFKNKSLFNYIYANKENKINGYKKCYFNGLTTLEISKKVINIIENNYIYGIYHLTGSKISKCELLTIINDIFDLKKEINEVDSPEISRLLIKDNRITNDVDKLNWNDMIYDFKINFIDLFNQIPT